MAAPASAISSTASRWRRSAAPRPRSACPTARIPICASTRSAATAREEQKRRYLPKLISGEHVGALAMSEPGAGSDVVSMRSAAEQAGDRYVLNGTKMWITNGPDGRDAGRLRQDRPGGRPARHHRLPDREGHEGLLHRARSSTSSACAAPTPASWSSRTARCRRRTCWAQVGRGVNVLMSGLDYERVVLAAGPLGIMQACLDVVLPYVHERKQFGQPIGKFQLMQGKLADMYTTMNAAAPMSMRWPRPATAARPRARTPPARSSIAAEKATRMALEAIQLLGGNGYINDYPTGRLLRDAKLYEIGAGTSEIRRMLIGRELFEKTA